MQNVQLGDDKTQGGGHMILKVFCESNRFGNCGESTIHEHFCIDCIC